MRVRSEEEIVDDWAHLIRTVQRRRRQKRIWAFLGHFLNESKIAGSEFSNQKPKKK